MQTRFDFFYTKTGCLHHPVWMESVRPWLSQGPMDLVFLPNFYQKILFLPLYSFSRPCISAAHAPKVGCRAKWSHLHGSSASNAPCYKQKHLLLLICALYDKAPQMLASDRGIFQELSYTEREGHTVAALNTFFRLASPIVDLSCKQAADMGRGFRPIDFYFRPTVPAPDPASLLPITPPGDLGV